MACSDTQDPDQFYTGLVSELYDPLVHHRARATDYTAFLDRAAGPALELGCGSGRPLLDLLALGYDVEGLDASADMLERCRSEALERGLEVRVHHARMQDFALPRRYAAVFLAGPTFNLLPSDADALAALRAIHAHLEPGGRLLIPLARNDPDAARETLGADREVRRDDGARLRVGSRRVETREDGRTLALLLRYEKQLPDGRSEVLLREFALFDWDPERFRALLGEAGFGEVALTRLDGAPAAADEGFFLASARRPSKHD